MSIIKGNGIKVHSAEKLWIVLGFLISCIGMAAANLFIEPAYIEVSLDEGRVSETIKVVNVTDVESRFRAQAAHFIYTQDGRFLEVEPDSHSLSQWIKFNPKEFTLAPQEAQIIRVSIIPPHGLERGEYWGAIHFEPLVGRQVESDDGAGHTMKLNIVTNILLPIVGQVGDPVPECEILKLEALADSTGVDLMAHVVNKGEARVRIAGTFEVLDADGSLIVEGPFGGDTILSEGERIFTRHVDGNRDWRDCTVRARYTSEKLSEVLAGQTAVRMRAEAGVSP